MFFIISFANSAHTDSDPELGNKYIEILSKQTDVDLRNQKIGDKEAMALAEALMTNKTVHRLNLSFNHIGEEGAAALAKALSLNYMLNELYLERNNLKPDYATKEHSKKGKDDKIIKYIFMMS